ncbi:MAG TPA: nitronate monooxygenase [Planctomycetota bacterium]|nr:nitronate monooxygenase [Planctomycetota bacterium]
MDLPQVIQGGMGAGVSGWRLAKAVAQAGQMGVVSGTALESIMARRLQDGDAEGHLRRALAHFPLPIVVKKILGRYFIPGGRPAGQPYHLTPMPSLHPSLFLQELTVAASFAEVWLAKEGHDGPVGVNYLEKIQLPNPASLYGAMLAGVDYVLMGAGIPREIPGILDRLALHQPVEMTIDVKGVRPGETISLPFRPQTVLPDSPAPLKRPKFLAIVASVTLAQIMTRKSTGKVDGFVVEHHTAGGHNAPPRGAMQLDGAGEPLYGARDEVKVADIKALGLPFWLAGRYGHPEKLQEALAQGATGVQMGTAFAFCEESGLTEKIRRAVLKRILTDAPAVRTDPRASPTSYPFKVVDLPGSLAEPAVYAARERRCDLGYLRELYREESGAVGYRCPGEPEAIYLRKGGDPADSVGRKCLCNGLVANIGLGQELENGYVEPPIVTAGNDLPSLRQLISPGKLDYTAADVLAYMFSTKAHPELVRPA